MCDHIMLINVWHYMRSDGAYYEMLESTGHKTNACGYTRLHLLMSPASFLLHDNLVSLSYKSHDHPLQYYSNQSERYTNLRH